MAYSSVFSPVDLSAPDFLKHPRARGATLWKCHVAAGDVLYLPPEWWRQAGGILITSTQPILHLHLLPHASDGHSP